MLSVKKFATAAVAVGMMAFGASSAMADSVNLSFDSAGDTAGWYKDRSDPQVFQSGVSGGGRDGVLQLGLRESGFQGNRGSQNGDFYNYHGRKYDLVGLEGHAKVSIDMFVNDSWLAGTRAGMWTTMSNGNLSYPIIEYVAGEGFRYWQSDSGWHDAGVGGSGWNTLAIELDGAQVLFSINGTQIAAVDALGAHAIDNVILQGHNQGPAGEYNIYFDNFNASVVPTPSAALAGFGLMGITALRRRRIA